MDNHPKRRKDRDNPYILQYNKNEKIYIISFNNGIKENKTVEISEEVYNAFNSFELIDISQMHEYERHIEHSELDDERLYKRTNYKVESVEEQVIKEIAFSELYMAIEKLPIIQKRRIKKYYFEGKNEIEIAKEENSTHQSVHIILERAKKNLKKILKNKKSVCNFFYEWGNK